MDGERFIVEEVRGAADELEAVDEAEAGVAVGELDGEHGAGGVAKLLVRQVVVGVVGQTDVVHCADGGEFAEAFGQTEGAGGLDAITGVERLESDGLHVGYVRRHVGAEVEEHLGAHAAAKVGRGAVVGHESADGGGATGEVFGGGDDLDVNAECARVEAGEGDERGVGHERHATATGDAREGAEVGHLHLRIGDDLEEEGAGAVVDGLLHGAEVGQVAEHGLDAKPPECAGDEGVGVAEKVARGDDLPSRFSQRKEGVADGGHAGAERDDVGGAGECANLILEESHGGVHDARIVRVVGATAEGIGHAEGVAKLVGCGVIDGHAQGAVGVRALKLGVDSLGLLLHSSFTVYVYAFVLENGAKVDIKKRESRRCSVSTDIVGFDLE